MGIETETIRANNAAEWRKWLTGLLVLCTIGVGLLFLFGGPEAFMRKAQIATGLSDDPHKAPIDALRAPQVVVNETISIPASGHQGRGFSIPDSRAVKVEVVGVRDTAKGFSVNLISPDEWGNISNGREFTRLAAFHGLKVSGMNETTRLPAGRYMIVVSNTQNIFNSMEVSLKITIDPN